MAIRKGNRQAAFVSPRSRLIAVAVVAAAGLSGAFAVRPAAAADQPIVLVQQLRELLRPLVVESFGNGRREKILAFNFRGGDNDCVVTVETELLNGHGPRYQAYDLDFGSVGVGATSSPSEIEFAALRVGGITRSDGSAERQVAWTLPRNPEVLALAQRIAQCCQALSM